MPGLVIAGKQVTIPGLRCVSWLDDPALRLQVAARPDGQRDGEPRPLGFIRAIVLHTTKGIPGGKDRRQQVIRPGLGPNTRAGERDVRFWSLPGKQAGAHLIIDFDGTVYCAADLVLEATFHVPGGVNPISVGCEIVQGSDAELYEGQLDAVVALCDALTFLLGVQRQIPEIYVGHPSRRLTANARSFCGVYGHRDADSNRGSGDPGDAIFSKLKFAGYEPWDIDQNTDIAAWTDRQRSLGMEADGIPGPRTVAALKAAGRLGGLWVSRPCDAGFAASMPIRLTDR